MHHFIEIWFGWVQHWGYLGIIVLMAMESSIFPVPSEIVIPPAAFLAAQGHLSYWGVIAAGTLGSYLGAAITYGLSLWLGRLIVIKFGRYFLLSEAKLLRAEQWVHRYEAGGIFFARLLPVIRHLISIPAGIIRMNFWVFSAMTIVGSFLWCWVLAYLGVQAYHAQPDLITNPEGMILFIKAHSHWIVLGIAVLAALYLLVMKLTAKPAAPPLAPLG